MLSQNGYFPQMPHLFSIRWWLDSRYMTSFSLSLVIAIFKLTLKLPMDIDLYLG